VEETFLSATECTWFYKKIHTAGALVHDPGAYEFRMVIEKLHRKESPGSDKMPGNFLKLG